MGKVITAVTRRKDKRPRVEKKVEPLRNVFPPRPIEERYDEGVISTMIECLRQGYSLESYNCYLASKQWETVLAHPNGARMIFRLALGLPFFFNPEMGSSEDHLLQNLELLYEMIRKARDENGGSR